MNTKLTVPDVRPSYDAYMAKPENINGGSLHIVSEDGNYADKHVQFCVDYAHERGDTDGMALAVMMLHLSITQRKKLCREHH